MVTCVNGIVVCKICWLAMLVRKSVIWLSMPRISLGPALLKPLSRSDVPPPAVVVKEIWGTVGPELVPNGEGMVMVSVADARFDDPIWIPPPTVAVMVKVAPLNVGVTCTLEGTSSEASSLELELTSRGARSMDATIGGWPARLIEALRRLRLTVAVIDGMVSVNPALTCRPVARYGTGVSSGIPTSSPVTSRWAAIEIWTGWIPGRFASASSWMPRERAWSPRSRVNDRAKLAVGSVTWIAGTTSVPSVTKAELKVKCTASTGGVSAIWFSLSTICCSVMVAVKSELT